MTPTRPRRNGGFPEVPSRLPLDRHRETAPHEAARRFPAPRFIFGRVWPAAGTARLRRVRLYDGACRL